MRRPDLRIFIDMDEASRKMLEFFKYVRYYASRMGWHQVASMSDVEIMHSVKSLMNACKEKGGEWWWCHVKCRKEGNKYRLAITYRPRGRRKYVEVMACYAPFLGEEDIVI